MKKIFFLVILFLSSSMFSCKKCSECHYDKGDEQIKIGEKCGKELENLEANGIIIDSVKYEVHCHIH